MSHAAVGQRSAQSPQCRQTFSSFTITRSVCLSAPDTKISCVVIHRRRREARAQLVIGSPLVVIVRQSTGQTSTQASHSMQSGAGEVRLDVAVQAALHLGRGLLRGEAELDLDRHAAEALGSSTCCIFWRFAGIVVVL